MNGLYFLLEDLGMTQTQRNVFFQENEQSGDGNYSPFPNLRNHQRKRPDNKAEIYEGLFSDLNIGTMISRLARSGVQSANNLRAQPVPASQWGQEWVFQYRPASTWINCCRWIVFGGVNASWQESLDLVSAYLAANHVAWEAPQ